MSNVTRCNCAPVCTLRYFAIGGGQVIDKYVALVLILAP